MKSTVENISFWHSACLCRNKITGRVEVESSKICWLLWLLNFLLHVAHVSFLFVRYIQFNYIEESAKASMKVYTEYAVVAYTIPLMVHICNYLRLDGLVDFLNEYKEFYGSIEGKIICFLGNFMHEGRTWQLK